MTKPGGFLLLSVMSLLGSTQQFLAGIDAAARQFGLDTVERAQASGDLAGNIANGHHCHMCRWSELEALLTPHACTILAASASNCLSIRNEETLQRILTDPELWPAFLRWEVEYAREPGALDGGTHVIAVVRRD